MVDPLLKLLNFVHLPITLRIRSPTVRSETFSVSILLACLSLSAGKLLPEGSLEESGVAEGRFVCLSGARKKPPHVDLSTSVHFWCWCTRMLSLRRRWDMIMPRRFGGCYKITGPDSYGPNSLVTISICCDELSSPSYIKYHLVGLKSHFIGHVKYIDNGHLLEQRTF